MLGGQTYSGGILNGPSVVDQMTAASQRFQDVAATQGLRAAMRDPVGNGLGLQAAGNFDLTGGIGGMAGIIAGKGAKTADLGALAKAEEMVASGLTPRAAYAATGWFKGPDGHWKFEIDDKDAYLRTPDSPHTPPGYQRLEHPDVEDAYPDLWARLQQAITPGPRMEGRWQDGDTLIAKGPDDVARKSAALHELQHAIQGVEGFAQGGNLSAAGSYDAYHRLAGEAEARAVQKRMAMNGLRRREEYPLDSYDVPLDQLIVRGAR